MGILAGLTSALLFGLSNLYIRRGQAQSGDLGMFATTLGNTIICAALLGLLGLIGLWSGAGFIGGATGGTGFVPAGIALFFLAGLLTTFIGRYLILEAMRRIGPSRAGSIRCLAPLFTTAAAVVILGDVIVPLQGLGAALAVTGLFILAGEAARGAPAAPATDSPRGTEPVKAEVSAPSVPSIGGGEGESPTVGRGARLTGVALALGSAAAYGFGYIARKAGLGYIPSPVLGATVGSVVAFTSSALILLSGIRGSGRTFRQAMPSALSPALVAGAVLTSSGMVVSFVSFYLATASVAAIFSSMEPLFTLALSRTILRRQEPISATAVVGVFVSVAGAAIVLAA